MAGRLCQAMLRLDGDASRLAVLKAVIARLGPDAYPALIKLLTIVSESSEQAAKTSLARTLGYAAQRGDLPEGQLNAWGLSRYISTDIGGDGGAVDASSFRRSLWAGSASRGLGPIEYLTVWHSQKTQRPYLTDAVYADHLTKLIALINADDHAATRYPRAILLDLETRTEGAFTRQTHSRLETIALNWLNARAPADIAAAALAV